MAYYNYGKDYSSNLNAGNTIIHNHGTISTSNLIASTIYNYNYLSTRYYDCRYMENSGIVEIESVAKVQLGKFVLMPKGILKLGAMVIRGDEPLDPKLSEYLERCGLKIENKNDSLLFEGVLRMDLKDAKLQLPHLFSKYDDAGAGYELLPGAWFQSSYPRLKSHSKKTGEIKYWRYIAIGDAYNTSKATVDVFVGRLARNLLGKDLNPSIKFDQFAKNVITRDIVVQDSDEAQKALINSNALCRYLLYLLTTTKPEDLQEKLFALADAKDEGAGWFSGLTGMFFGAAKPTDESNIFQKPKNVQQQDLMLALEKVMSLINADNFEVFEQIKQKFAAQFLAVNNKFTITEIEQQIYPEVEQCMSRLKLNIGEVPELLVKLQEQQLIKENDLGAVKVKPISK